MSNCRRQHVNGVTPSALSPSSALYSSLLSPYTCLLLRHCPRLPHSIRTFSRFFRSHPRWSCPQLPPDVLPQYSEPCALALSYSVFRCHLPAALPGKALPVFMAQLQQTLPGTSSDAQSGAANPNICLYLMKDTCLIQLCIKVGVILFSDL